MYGLEQIILLNEENRALKAVARKQAEAAAEDAAALWPFIVVGEGNPHYRDGVKWFVQGPGGYESERFNSSAEAHDYAVQLKRGSE